MRLAKKKAMYTQSPVVSCMSFDKTCTDNEKHVVYHSNPWSPGGNVSTTMDSDITAMQNLEYPPISRNVSGGVTFINESSSISKEQSVYILRLARLRLFAAVQYLNHTLPTIAPTLLKFSEQNLKSEVGNQLTWGICNLEYPTEIEVTLEVIRKDGISEPFALMKVALVPATTTEESTDTKSNEMLLEECDNMVNSDDMDGPVSKRQRLLVEEDFNFANEITYSGLQLSIGAINNTELDVESEKRKIFFIVSDIIIAEFVRTNRRCVILYSYYLYLSHNHICYRWRRAIGHMS